MYLQTHFERIYLYTVRETTMVIADFFSLALQDQHSSNQLKDPTLFKFSVASCFSICVIHTMTDCL
ncbi:hypothetical protein MTR_8g006905 [Medicago truncatula]|uniref:Uncharacterized protein n=1 Tax=Medicago truncatula TaxID=3880 RepID=A0A072TKA4_MEDTR|nr:hypothetical protein MTR_8g006905 [Medicago truncatula]